MLRGDFAMRIVETAQPAPLKYDFQRLEEFLAERAKDLYAEPITDIHTGITREMIGRIHAMKVLPRQPVVLDIGCGQAPAFPLMTESGWHWVGITRGPDYEICRAKGLAVYEMDQSFLDFPSESFDLVWARHVLEHSPFPYFTLTEYARVMQRGGYAYIEVPQEGTVCHHENNPNHYSILPPSMWLSLFKRVGLALVQSGQWTYECRFEQLFADGTSRVDYGQDVFHWFLLRKDV
jgi:SAM-dependent methyltransferase